jgi:hypothetical protein
MNTAFRILKVGFQIVTIVIPFVKGIFRILEQNNFRSKR